MPRHTLAGSGRLDAARIRSHGPRRRRIITRQLGRWGTGWAACTHGRRGMTESSRPCDAIVGASGADAPGTQLIVPGVPGFDRRRSWLAHRLESSHSRRGRCYRWRRQRRGRCERLVVAERGFCVGACNKNQLNICSSGILCWPVEIDVDTCAHRHAQRTHASMHKQEAEVSSDSVGHALSSMRHMRTSNVNTMHPSSEHTTFRVPRLMGSRPPHPATSKHTAHEGPDAEWLPHV